MESAIAGGILLAFVYMFVGCVLVYAVWFVINILWIMFGPTPKPGWHRTEDGGSEYY